MLTRQRFEAVLTEIDQSSHQTLEGGCVSADKITNAPTDNPVRHRRWRGRYFTTTCTQYCTFGVTAASFGAATRVPGTSRRFANFIKLHPPTTTSHQTSHLKPEASDPILLKQMRSVSQWSICSLLLNHSGHDPSLPVQPGPGSHDGDEVIETVTISLTW